MKVLISENKFKTFLKDKLGIDLTDKVSLITSGYDLPMSFDRYLGTAMLNVNLNEYGPMYLIRINGSKYLYQNRGRHDFIMNSMGGMLETNHFRDILELPPLGVSIQQILDLYVEE
jgi:hypothetical protein